VDLPLQYVVITGAPAAVLRGAALSAPELTFGCWEKIQIFEH